jgi:hypothetical protein
MFAKQCVINQVVNHLGLDFRQRLIVGEISRIEKDMSAAMVIYLLFSPNFCSRSAIWLSINRNVTFPGIGSLLEPNFVQVRRVDSTKQEIPNE